MIKLVFVIEQIVNNNILLATIVNRAKSLFPIINLGEEKLLHIALCNRINCNYKINSFKILLAISSLLFLSFLKKLK